MSCFTDSDSFFDNNVRIKREEDFVPGFSAASTSRDSDRFVWIKKEEDSVLCFEEDEKKFSQFGSDSHVALKDASDLKRWDKTCPSTFQGTAIVKTEAGSEVPRASSSFHTPFKNEPDSVRWHEDRTMGQTGAVLQNKAGPEPTSWAAVKAATFRGRGGNRNSKGVTQFRKQKSNFQCPECGLMFEKKRFLKRHSKKSHGKGVKCFYCFAFFATDEERCVHVSQHPEEAYLFHRQAQKLRYLDRQNQLAARHPEARKNKKMKSFPCDLCNRSFDTEHGLKQHRKQHSYSISCPDCSSFFRDKIGLRKHYKIHMDNGGGKNE